MTNHIARARRSLIIGGLVLATASIGTSACAPKAPSGGNTGPTTTGCINCGPHDTLPQD